VDGISLTSALTAELALPLKLCTSTLDPQVPPMFRFRCERDKMQKTTSRQGVFRNHAFLLIRSSALQARAERRLRRLRRSDLAGNSVSMPGQKPWQEAA
jgi:hypothetical protein